MDIWQAFAGQETAKRAIEIALIGGHAIALTPYEGAGWSFTETDVHKLPTPSRAIARAHVLRVGNPAGIGAAMLACDQAREAMQYLATLAEIAPGGIGVRSAPISVSLAPITLADLVLPPPAEEAATVVARILSARERLHLMDEHLDHQAAALEKSWRDAVGATDAEAEDARAVARTITALCYHSKGPAITRIAYAEALSYHRRYDAADDYSAPPLNARELGAVLAGLRAWQAFGDDAPDEINEIASNCETFRPLDADEIDHLCERINA